MHNTHFIQQLYVALGIATSLLLAYLLNQPAGPGIGLS